MLLGGGSQGALIRDILISGGVMERVTFPGFITNNRLAALSTTWLTCISPPRTWTGRPSR